MHGLAVSGEERLHLGARAHRLRPGERGGRRPGGLPRLPRGLDRAVAARRARALEGQGCRVLSAAPVGQDQVQGVGARRRRDRRAAVARHLGLREGRQAQGRLAPGALRADEPALGAPRRPALHRCLHEHRRRPRGDPLRPAGQHELRLQRRRRRRRRRRRTLGPLRPEPPAELPLPRAGGRHVPGRGALLRRAGAGRRGPGRSSSTSTTTATRTWRSPTWAGRARRSGAATRCGSTSTRGASASSSAGPSSASATSPTATRSSPSTRTSTVGSTCSSRTTGASRASRTTPGCRRRTACRTGSTGTRAARSRRSPTRSDSAAWATGATPPPPPTSTATETPTSTSRTTTA